MEFCAFSGDRNKGMEADKVFCKLNCWKTTDLFKGRILPTVTPQVRNWELEEPSRKEKHNITEMMNKNPTCAIIRYHLHHIKTTCGQKQEQQSNGCGPTNPWKVSSGLSTQRATAKQVFAGLSVESEWRRPMGSKNTSCCEQLDYLCLAECALLCLSPSAIYIYIIILITSDYQC